MRRLEDNLQDRTARRNPVSSGAPRKKIGKQQRFLVAGVSLLALTGLIASTTPASAVVPPSTGALPTLATSTQFDVTGFLKSATLDQTCVANAGANPDPKGPIAHCGGVAVINGHTIVIPAETMVILPASALTWQELFAKAPAPWTGAATGMALDDVPTPPYTTYETHIVGNRVIDLVGTNGCAATSVGYVAATTTPAVAAHCDRYIAGLVNISQQDLNAGAGYINFIHYDSGFMEVGGQLGVANTGTFVMINDPAVTVDGSGNPTGRYGRANDPTLTPKVDERFMVDQDNPTILAETGYPMCLPRVNPNQGATAPEDSLCPQENRPLSTGLKDPLTGQQHPPAGEFDTFWMMDDPANLTTPANCITPGACLDPSKQVPFEIGDYVNFSGNLVKDTGLNGGPNGGYILAHTIVASLGIYTQPGINPAYVSIDVSLIGTGGLTVLGAGEAVVRTRFEGMTTDPSRNVRVYAVDINPDGTTTDRDLGTVGVDPGPIVGAVRGRWRLRPPCKLAAGSTPTQKDCTLPPAGTYLPPPREVRAVIEGLQSQDPQNAPVAQTSANGIFYGQYHAPVDEYIFPENVPGLPVPENNFNTMPFLAQGGYTSITGVRVGVLNPWPSNKPATVPAIPTIIGGPYSVSNGLSNNVITLSGSVNADATAPVTFSWTAGTTRGGTDLNGNLTGANTTTPTFTATGLSATTYFLRLTTSNVTGSNFVDDTIVVTDAPVPLPSINPIPNQTVTVNTPVTITASSATQPAPDTWTWSQTAGTAVTLTQTDLVGSSSVAFTPTAAGTYTFTVTAANSGGASPATPVTITVNPKVQFAIGLPTVEYRVSQRRLILATSGVPLDTTSVVVQPYRTNTGTMFDPATLGATLTNAGGGVWNITMVGAPPPACNTDTTKYTTPCTGFKPILVVGNAPGAIYTSSPSSKTSAPLGTEGSALTRIK